MLPRDLNNLPNPNLPCAGRTPCPTPAPKPAPAPTPTPTRTPTSKPTPKPAPTPTPTLTPAAAPAPVVAPGGFGCSWLVERPDQVECSWQPAADDAKYEVQYKAMRRGSVLLSRTKPVSTARYRIGVPRSVDTASVRARATRPGETGPYTEWATAARPGPAPRNLEVECRADARVYVSWDPVTGASRYTAAITSTPPPAPAAVSLASTEHLTPSFPGARPPASFNFSGQPNWSYAVRLTAEASGTASLPATASATCTPVTPPAPTGVTASCANRALTVTWNTAGTGLAKATSYKPRIFTGNPPTESTRWTADAAGHGTTTAAIPGPGEPDLPDTGVFQVKVKAANNAGDSPYSTPAKATCGAPRPVSGFRCVETTSSSITVEWDALEEATTYKLMYPKTGSFSDEIWNQFNGTASSKSPNRLLHTFTSRGDGRDIAAGYSYSLGIMAVSDGGEGPPSYAYRCKAPANGWLRVDCSSEGELSAEWASSSTSQDTVTVVDQDGQTFTLYDGLGSHTRLEPSRTVAFGGTYKVSLASDNGDGQPVRSQSKTARCMPGPISGLKCSASTPKNLAVEWDAVVGADNYAVKSSYQQPTIQMWNRGYTNIGKPEGPAPDKHSYTFTDLFGTADDHNYWLGVRAENSKGKGDVSHIWCKTVDNDWVEAECSSTRVLDVSWDNPPDQNQSYTVILTSPADPPAARSTRSFPFAGTGAATRWTTPGPIGQTKQGAKDTWEEEYRVVVASNGHNGHIYSHSVKGSCSGSPSLVWDSPNDDGDSAPSWLSLGSLLLPNGWYHLAVHGETPAETWHDTLVGEQNPTFGLASRTCRTPTQDELAADSDLDRVCEEAWSESINVRLDPVWDWRDVETLRVWDAITNQDIVSLTTTGISLRDVYVTIRKNLDAGKTLRVAVRRAAGRFLATEALFYLYNASTNQDWVRIYPEQGCLNSQSMAYDEDVGFAPVTATSTAHETVNGYKTKTTATIKYCKEGAEPASS